MKLLNTVLGLFALAALAYTQDQQESQPQQVNEEVQISNQLLEKISNIRQILNRLDENVNNQINVIQANNVRTEQLSLQQEDAAQPEQ